MTRRTAALAAGGILAAVLLSGCNGQFLDNPQTASPSPAETSEEQPLIEPTPNVTPSPDSTTIPKDIGGVLSRSNFEGQVTDKRDCGGQPVSIADKAGAVVSLTGDCPEITVSGNGVAVLMTDIGSVTVSADNAAVFFNQANEAIITGDSNVVVWRTGSPAVKDSGRGNLATVETDK